MFISLDLETTGLDPRICQVLEIGAYAFGNGPEYSEFQCFVKHGTIVGEARALHMNAEILLKADYEGLSPMFAMNQLLAWMEKLSASIDGGRRHVLCGKNIASFDWQFLLNMPHADTLKSMVRHSFLDAGPLWMEATDTTVPSLSECLKRAGMETDVPHRALEDAKLVARLIQRKLWDATA